MNTDNKSHEEILSAEMLARSIIEQAGEAIIVCDEEGRIIRASRLAHVLCGQNLLLKPFNDLFRLHITDTECLFSVLTPLHGGNLESVEVELKQNDGQIYHLLLNATPLKSAQGQIIGCVVTLADITERRQAEDELRQSKTLLQVAYQQLQETNEELQAQKEELHSQSEVLQAQAEELLVRNQELAKLWDDSRLTKDALAEIQERLMFALSSSKMGIFEWDIVNDKFIWDDSIHRLLMTNPLTFTGTAEEFYRVIHPDDSDAVQIALTKAVNTDGAYDTEYRAVWPDGTIHHIAARGKVHRNSAGEADHMTGICWDITERKQAESSTCRQNALLYGINLILEETLSVSTNEALAETCLAVAEEITGSRFGFIGELGPDGLLHDIAISNPGWEMCSILEKTRDRRSSIDLHIHGVYGRVILDGKGFFTNDPASHPDSVGTPDGHPRLTAFLGVPLIHDDKTIGMIALGNREGGYSREELEALESLAPSMVLALHRKRDEEALRRSEEKYRSLFDSLIEGFCIIEVLFDANNHPIDYRFLEINPAFEAQTGLHDVQGKLMRELVPEHEPYWFEIYGKVALTGNSIRFVYEMNALNRWYDVSAYRVGGQDSRKVAILFNDITAVKKAEMALKASEERLALALEGGRMGLWEWDTRTERSVWNNTEYQLLGLPVGDGNEPKHLFFDRVHPDDIGPINRILAKVMKHGGDFYHELRITRADDGQERWLAAAGRLFRNAVGQPVKIIGVNFDVTARKHAEQELKQLNEELENRVAERTKELLANVKKLITEIVERKKAEESVLRLNRLYMVASETSQVIIRTMDRETIFNEFCRIAVEDGKFKLAWVGLVDEENGELKIVAAKGATGYLDEIKITANEEPAGSGPTGISVREGTYYISTDLLGSPITRPWHEKDRAHGIRASASVALKQEGEVIGALTLYTDKKDFFDRQQNKLLQQMGADVSFALDNIVRETRRKEAEQALREETNERLLATEALREKEQMLIQQGRQAAMGEMIGNIAHQWRQPLNILGLTIQQLLLFYDMNEFTREFLEQSVGKSMQLIQHMSKTIDDFRNFFRPDKEKVEFELGEAITSTLSLIEDSFKNEHIRIKFIANSEPVIVGYRNEYAQVILNVLNNARDVFKERNIKNPKVSITIFTEGGRAVVTIADNAGGIPEEIIGRIFDPYFSTKGPQAGTGVGLFMSKTIIESNMGGSLSVRNHGDGAEFRIEV